MKQMKKIFALLIAMVMVLGMSIMVFAAGGTPSITINPNNDDADTSSLEITYTYYKILTASIDTDPVVGADGSTTTKGKAAYYVENQTQATALENTGVFTVTKVDDVDKWYVELVEGKTIEDIVDAFDNNTFLANFTEQEYTKQAGTASAVLPNVSAGYYFIRSSLGTKAAVQTLSPVTINEKNSYPTIDKDYTAATDALAGIGDVISYTITVEIPESVASKPITITDTMTKGLTINTAVTVTDAAADPAYTSTTWTAAGQTDDGKANIYTITIPAATVIANKGKTLKFTYTAVVNENAVVLEAETNKAHLDYDGYTTVDTETVGTKTLAFTLQKVDGTDLAAGTTTELPGARFHLENAAGGTVSLVDLGNNTYRVATDNDATTTTVIVAGSATINGLNDEQYTLVEDKAPTGYNKLDEGKTITPSEATSATGVDIQIENNKGTTLPSTGGTGTTIFYIIGAALVIGAGVVLVTRRRMKVK